ncbi:molybdate ABC transporter substrate-binding protein [Bacillaceae bacterium Marseille-Q3522]|nr:molybdate ABC transporter substrate-binding protein [Bacillaceae bacterium Marseille-Q3522]
MKRFYLILIAFFSILLTACGTASSDSEKEEELVISAAASLKNVLTEIASIYKEDTLRFNFGASGALQQQISQGAPADLFFSAAEDKFQQLVDEGVINANEGSPLLRNELVLIQAKNSTFQLSGIADLTNEEVKKLSIGTPEAVPAGKYAQQSLEALNVWENVHAKIVFAKDVRQVLNYVETESVDAGLVYKTDALSSTKVRVAAVVSPATHDPIIYPAGVIKTSSHREQALAFYHFLQSEKARIIFEKYGFTSVESQ